MYLSDVIQSNKRLGNLFLWDNFIGDKGLFHLSEALRTNQKLKWLCLENNKFEDEGLTYLSDGLRDNHKLKKLSLNNNRFGDKGLSNLTEALRVNSALIYEDLFPDSFSSEIYREFVRVFYDNGGRQKAGEERLSLQA